MSPGPAPIHPSAEHPNGNHHGEDGEEEEEIRSEEEAVTNPFSLALFAWVSPMFTRGWERYKEGKVLTEDDLLRLPREETSRVSYDQFSKQYRDWTQRCSASSLHRNEKTPPSQTDGDAVSSNEPFPSSPPLKTDDDADGSAPNSDLQNPMKLLLLMMQGNRKDLLMGVLFRLLQDTGNIGSPFILRALIQWFGRYAIRGSAGGENAWEGFVYAVVLAVNGWLLWVFTNTSLFYTNKAFARMRSALAMAVYEKTLRLDRSQVQNVGRIQQMHASDTYKFIDMSIFMNALWASPLIIIAALVALYFFVGWAGLLALATLLVITPSQAKVTTGMMGIRRKTVTIADERIQAVNEFCQGIRIIKFMCWEPSTIENILSIRSREVAHFRMLYLFRSAMLTVMFSTGFVISLVVFGVAYAIGDPIRPENVFPTMAMINVLRQPLTQLPLALARVVDCNVGLRRICEFLSLKEKDSYVAPFKNAVEASLYAAVLENVTAMYQVNNSVTGLLVSPSSPTGVRRIGGGRSKSVGGGASTSPIGLDGPALAPPVLRPFMGPITISIPRGKLTIVIGPTGGGKSSLLDMIIGEAQVDRTCNFRVSSPLGDVAYMTQEAWIMNATLKQNILMGSEYDAQRYIETVNAYQLIADLEQLAASDATEIGERGINLSGGQKQRVAFARAVYSGRSVVLMDDPLSAVDSHVCTALFHRCIQGAVMRGRTRVLVTHAIQFLPEADNIIVVDRCAIAFQGTYDELLASGIDPSVYTVGAGSPTPGEGASPSNAAGGWSDASVSNSPIAVSLSKEDGGCLHPIPVPKQRTKDSGTEVTTGTTLMAKEHQETGSIKAATIAWYIKQQGIGWFITTLICFSIAQAVNVATQLILSWWSAKTTLVGERITEESYIMWYGVFIAAAMASLFLQTIPFNKAMLNCSRDCHEWMLRSILRAPTMYYDSTPVGRVLSRFSKDLDNMDQQIPWTLGTTYQLVFSIIGAMAIMTYSVQYLLVMWAVTLVLFTLLFSYYGATNRAQKRLEAVNRTPMASIMNETLGGLSTVRAYGMIPFYQKKHEVACDLSSRSTYSWRLSQRWLSVRIQGLGAFIVLTASVVFCGVIISMDTHDAIANLPVMALSLTNAIAMAQFLGILTNLSSELESALSSVERVKEYCDELPQERDVVYHLGQGDEAPAVHPSERFVNHNTSVAPPLPVGWPSSGELCFQHASLRYRPGLPLVLRNLTFKIPSGAKVGVVGRTGSGKSTLMLALFRILELAQLTESERTDVTTCAESGALQEDLSSGDLQRNGGAILLDGRDIASVALRDLRSAITIIPQDPLLFAGTVRSNVDPFSQHSDAKVWSVIEQVGLIERIQSSARASSGNTADDASIEISSALDCPVAARGSNFSVGQRQLLCLARALLKDCRLLLLDEATASVDQDTDSKIQQTIRQSFAHCTVLTIAHRLQTVMDSDKVLVMESGVAVEYDAPFSLLSKKTDSPSSKAGEGAVFKRMVEALGAEQAAAMYAVAEQKFYAK